MTRGMSYVCAVIGALVWVQSATAIPDYLTAWQNKYPTSTLPARMQAVADTQCHVCHHPPTRDVLGNCYRMDLKALLDGGATIEDAIDQLDTEDSDGDGVSNGEEATTPRVDQPGEVGYNMGLVGPTGVDPCSPLNFGIPVTNELETPPLVIPAVSAWGMTALTLLVLVVGSLMFRLKVRPLPAIIQRRR